MPYGDGTGPVGIGQMMGGGAGFGCGFRHFNGVGRQRFAMMPNFDNPAPSWNVDAEKNYLKKKAEFLKQSLESINKRLENLETEKAVN